MKKQIMQQAYDEDETPYFWDLPVDIDDALRQNNVPEHFKGKIIVTVEYDDCVEAPVISNVSQCHATGWLTIEGTYSGHYFTAYVSEYDYTNDKCYFGVDFYKDRDNFKGKWDTSLSLFGPCLDEKIEAVRQAIIKQMTDDGWEFRYTTKE